MYVCELYVFRIVCKVKFFVCIQRRKHATYAKCINAKYSLVIFPRSNLSHQGRHECLRSVHSAENWSYRPSHSHQRISCFYHDKPHSTLRTGDGLVIILSVQVCVEKLQCGRISYMKHVIVTSVNAELIALVFIIHDWLDHSLCVYYFVIHGL